MKKRRLTRRTFLRGAGGVAVGLPFLNMALPGTPAFGEGMATGAAPKRIIFMVHPNGVIPDTWFPTAGASETDFMLNSVHEPLEDFKDKLVLLENVDMSVGGVGPGGMHQQGMGGVLTGRVLNEGDFRGNAGRLAGWASGISIDQYLAKKLDASTPYGSLEIGVRADHHAGSEVMTRISYLGSDQPLPPQNDPVELFNALFADAMTDNGALDKIKLRRASVLDGVHDQFKSLYARAGYEDKLRLEHHEYLLRDLERRLELNIETVNSIASSGSCSIPQAPEDLDPNSKENMEAVFRNQMDLLAVALACDLTRVATFQISNAWNKILFPWIDSNVEGHTLSHAGPSNIAYNEQWTKRNTWYSEQLAYLLGRLAEIPEGDGTLLDNTAVVWTSEVAKGNTHSWTNMPVLIAGGMGGSWQTGRYIQYQTRRSTNDLFVSLINAFGFEDTVFGDERFCNGALPGLV